ncbi:MAG: hypothetical protein LBH40_00510 [Alphaproteobacteria bacterium]|jgi:hypothetical protein|nr:hypothetical protein [Alphaproteobacteria bacterium]
MKSKIFIVIFLLFSFTLMADEEELDANKIIQDSIISLGLTPPKEEVNENKQLEDDEDEDVYRPFSLPEPTGEIRRNIITLGLGVASSKALVSTKSALDSEYTPYENISEFNAVFNFNASYLAVSTLLNNKLAFGLDLGAIVSSGFKDFESTRDSTGFYNGTITTTLDYNIYTVMLLANYEIFKIWRLDLSAQAGAGLSVNNLDYKKEFESFNSCFDNTTHTYIACKKYSDSKNRYSITPAYKVGLLVNYHLTDILFVGLGAYYLQNGESKDTLFNNNYKIKNNGIMLYNFKFKFVF